MLLVFSAHPSVIYFKLEGFLCAIFFIIFFIIHILCFLNCGFSVLLYLLSSGGVDDAGQLCTGLQSSHRLDQPSGEVGENRCSEQVILRCSSLFQWTSFTSIAHEQSDCKLGIHFVHKSVCKHI